MQFGFWDWAQAVGACLFLNWVAWVAYKALGTSQKFRSRAKRLAMVGVLPVLGVGLLLEVWYLSTH